MIKRIRKSLSVKVFMLTATLAAACCAFTYFCTARFAPYIYTYDLTAIDEVMPALTEEISFFAKNEAKYVFDGYADFVYDEFKDEFVLHLFQSDGAEIDLSDMKALKDKRITDYDKNDTTKRYKLTFADDTEEYTFLAAKNTDKESQIVQALQKSIPVLSAAVIAASLIAAFFYTVYMTVPIKRISKISKRMAALDFGSICDVRRTDEIGVLSESLNELSENLSSALSELQKANQKLQADIDMERQLERQRLDFFSAASHELKTPITIIKGQLQGMLYQVGRYKDRETYLAKSVETAECLEAMANDLLTISRIDSPEYNCIKRDFDLGGLINSCLENYEDLLVQKELTVQKSVQSDIVITGDARLIQKVFNNLLSNAAAYSEAGNHVIVNLHKEAEDIIFTIENTGAHIPDDDIPRLFEAFYRVDQSRNRKTGGTGLGLYIVKTILDLHNAKIKITSSAESVIAEIIF